MKISVDLPELPKGYEYTGEYRLPNEGCKFLDVMGEVSYATRASSVMRFIIRKSRWRAGLNDMYYTIMSGLEIYQLEERGDQEDSRLYGIGNYFKTKEMAQEAVKLYKEALEKVHANR